MASILWNGEGLGNDGSFVEHPASTSSSPSENDPSALSPSTRGHLVILTHPGVHAEAPLGCLNSRVSLNRLTAHQCELNTCRGVLLHRWQRASGKIPPLPQCFKHGSWQRCGAFSRTSSGLLWFCSQVRSHLGKSAEKNRQKAADTGSRYRQQHAFNEPEDGPARPHARTHARTHSLAATRNRNTVKNPNVFLFLLIQVCFRNQYAAEAKEKVRR